MKKYLLNWMLIVLLAGCNFYSKEEAIMHNAPAKANEHNNVEGNVNSNLAAIVAENFLESLTEGTDFKVSGIDSIVDYKGRTALYVFNFSPKGFVITSNNVCNEPIVAYSDEGGFEKINKETPVALLYWLSNTILFNEYIRENEDAPMEAIENNIVNWQDNIPPAFKKEIPHNHYINIDPCFYDDWKLIETQQTKIGEFMTTEWGQRDPYDFFVPKDCPVGCVAVAVGQIMKFHKYPNDSNDPKFNWNIMPDIAQNINQQGAINIALLLKDIGEKVNMRYAPSASGAYSIDARNALVNDYGYSSSANLADYNHRRVVNDIVSKRSPIYMDGFAEKKIYYWRWWLVRWHYEPYEVYSDGHAWVCDGYKKITEKKYSKGCDREILVTREFLYMNWGWNGWYNGWYSNNSRPNSSSDPNFPYKRQCIYDIHKP